jgi:hypothetical protein
MIGGSSPSRRWEFFSSPPRPDRLWGPLSLLSNGYQGPFRWRRSGRGVKLATHLLLVPRSKNAWSHISTPQYTFIAWCSVKAQGQLYLLYFSQKNGQNWDVSTLNTMKISHQNLIIFRNTFKYREYWDALKTLSNKSCSHSWEEDLKLHTFCS